MKYKIIVSYDGTDFQGWQTQINGPTVAGTLEKTFLSVFKKSIRLLGASRTDAGVHALGQTASFKVDLDINPQQLQTAWNNKLPKSIAILDVSHVNEDYNPHAYVKEKTYEYTFTTKRPLPFVARYQWFYPWPFEQDKLKKALQLFIGTHDFRSFCSGTDHKSTIRTIIDISLKQMDDTTYTITFKGPAFLRYMIRRITGACLEIASRSTLTISYLQSIKDALNPEHTLPSAPALGLVLKSITYNKQV